jgi:hypothetical protein
VSCLFCQGKPPAQQLVDWLNTQNQWTRNQIYNNWYDSEGES